jgi:hypothetical protein
LNSTSCCVALLSRAGRSAAPGGRRMAEDNRPTPPDKSSGALSRPLPGSGGLTPAQIRRGFLPADTSFPADSSQPVADQDKPAAADATTDSQNVPGLPRRVPGTSAIQRPPSADQDTASAGPAAAARKPGPEQLAASAARLRRPKMVMPKADAKRRDSAGSAQSAWAVAPTPTQANAHTNAEPAPALPQANAHTLADLPAPAPAQANAQNVAEPSPRTPAEGTAPGARESSASPPEQPRPPETGAPPSARAKVHSPAATTSSPTAESAPAAAQQPGAESASSGGPVAEPSRGSRLRSSRRARRWQLAGLLVVIAAVLATMLAIALAHRHPANSPGSMRSLGAEFIAGRSASHR